MTQAAGLLGVRTFRVPRSHALEAHAHLQRVGREGLEGFALWAGALGGDTFRVVHTRIPAQTGLRRESGVCVTVGAEELHRTNVWLFEHGLMLGAQLHSHPGPAFHSETDDAYPIATTLGSLSIVVPDFARRPFALERCAVYRLVPGRGWSAVPPAQVRRLITLE